MSKKPKSNNVNHNNLLKLWLPIILAIIPGTAVVASAIIANYPIVEITPSIILIFTSAPTFIPTPTPMLTLTPYICPFQGQTDDETITNLIVAEADATNFKDFSIIENIFDPGAVFYDYASEPPKKSRGPTAHYKDDLFKNTEFTGVKHFDISPAGPGIDGDTAYYTSGSMGYYLNDKGVFEPFFNSSSKSLPPTPMAKFGSDHWLLKKNGYGCWVIYKLEFNAGHIPFPE